MGDKPQPDVESRGWYIENKRQHHWRQFVMDLRSASQRPQDIYSDMELCQRRAEKYGSPTAGPQWRAWLVYWAAVRLTM